MHAAGPEGWSNIKNQFKRADASGARMALVFGTEELARGEVSIKSLRDPAVPQRAAALADAAGWAADLRAP
jgi:histidyl-tRNA synthetase